MKSTRGIAMSQDAHRHRAAIRRVSADCALAGAGPDLRICLQRPTVGVYRHTGALRFRRGPPRTRGLGVWDVVGSSCLELYRKATTQE